jgi:hypothetical protein
MERKEQVDDVEWWKYEKTGKQLYEFLLRKRKNEYNLVVLEKDLSRIKEEKVTYQLALERLVI